MNNSIKYTTLATYIAIASIGGIIGAKYTELKHGIKSAPEAQETAQAREGYDTKGMTNLVASQSFINLPEKPTTNGIY